MFNVTRFRIYHYLRGRIGPLLLPALLIKTLVLLGLAFSALQASGASGEFTVKREPVYDLKSLFASVQTVDVTQARARIGGTLVELLVDEGAIVKAGQKLARVRDPKQRLQIAATESKLRSLEAQLQLAKTTLGRVAKLYASGKISEARQDEAQTQVDVVSADIAALKSDQAVIRQAQIEGDILAPASGRVLKVSVTHGSVVLPGEPIANIAAESYILRLMLPERHARFI
ncbi:MAG: efflux RND transporter periplasmic adaptor subunit, partial [Porticoccaceae bacterium]|nr:efflux RND transporter periplasmic adaptor subunit [Porticoccaceae bacterium]